MEVLKRDWTHLEACFNRRLTNKQGGLLPENGCKLLVLQGRAGAAERTVPAQCVSGLSVASLVAADNAQLGSSATLTGF